SDCYAYAATGIKSAQSVLGMIQVYPNPTDNKVTIKTENKLNNADIRLSNIIGQSLMTKNNFSGYTLSFDVSGLADGVYIIEINEDGTVFRTKVVKKK